MAWSGKKVKELLVELSEDGKMFKTKPSTKKVTSERTGYKLTTQGYFEIGEALWRTQTCICTSILGSCFSRSNFRIYRIR